MIKATECTYEGNTDGKRKVIVSLVADTPDEVMLNGTSGLNVKGLQSNDEMTFGSTCLCITGEFGLLDSSGNWVFS